MKPPAFQFYADNFVGGTSMLSTLEVGVYILLLCHQWTNGSLPADETRLFLIARTNNEPPNEAAVRYVVRTKFAAGEDGRLRNVRMESVRALSHEWSEKSKKGGQISAIKRVGNAGWGKQMAGQRTNNEPPNEPPNEPLVATINEHFNSNLQSSSCLIDKSNAGRLPVPRSPSVRFDSIKIAKRIVSNHDGWNYDNCKVGPGFKATPLASVIAPALQRGRSEALVIRAWLKAVKLTHAAATDGMVDNPLAYCVATFKEQLNGMGEGA